MEATGHKVIILPSEDELRAADVRQPSAPITPMTTQSIWCSRHGFIFITELGTIYSKAELTELHEACAECSLRFSG